MRRAVLPGRGDEARCPIRVAWILFFGAADFARAQPACAERPKDEHARVHCALTLQLLPKVGEQLRGGGYDVLVALPLLPATASGQLFEPPMQVQVAVAHVQRLLELLA